MWPKGRWRMASMSALIGYTLAPDATLDEIVAEIHAGIDYLTGQLPALGAAAERHRGVRLVRRRAPDLDGAVASAGEGGDGDHQASTISSRSATPISTRNCGRMKQPARRNSPMMQEGGPLKPLSLVVGSAELPLLRKQTADFAGHRARYGLPVTYEEIPDAEPLHHHVRDDVAEGEDHDADPAVVRADDGLGPSDLMVRMV